MSAKNKLIVIVMSLAVHGMPEAAEAETGGQTPDESFSEGRTTYNNQKLNAFFVRGNRYTLANPNQEFELGVSGNCIFYFFCSDPVKPLKVTFDSSSMTTTSFGYERLLDSGWFSYGAEFYRLSSDYQVEGVTSSEGRLDMNNLVINTKFYFIPNSAVKPYAGIGGGLSHMNMSGPISASKEYMLMAKYELGVSYQSDNYIIRAGYEGSNSFVDFSSASVRYDDGYSRMIQINNHIKYTGYYIGMALRF